MEVFRKGGTYYCRCSFNERHLAKDANFFFNSSNKIWYTHDFKSALRLREYFSDELKSELNKYTVKKNAPWTLAPPIPKDKKLNKSQIAGFKFAMRRNHSYLALEPGVGKTPLSVALINELFCAGLGLQSCLLVVPPFLITNWIREIRAWQVFDYEINIITSKNLTYTDGAINIVADSIIAKDYVINLFEELKKDIGLLIVDESHRFNNESQRTEALLGTDLPATGLRSTDCINKKAKKVVYLSGTPFDKPIQLYPVLSSSAANLIKFRSRLKYASYFCDGRMMKVKIKVRGRVVTKQIFNVDGSSNEAELQTQLKKFMLFKTLEETVKMKGFKESLVVLDLNKNLPQKIKQLEKKNLTPTKVKDIIESDHSMVGDIAMYRKQVAIEKIKPCTEYLKNILESSKESILVFGIHTELLTELKENLKDFNPGLIIGSTPMKERDKIEKEFMSGKRRLIIANIKTMVGLNLTAARRGYFVESDWTRSGNKQARDRLFRIGQNKFCYFEHLTLANTLDEYILRKVINQEQVINRIL